MATPDYQFSEQELKDFCGASDEGRAAILALLSRAVETAGHFVDSAQTDREAAVSQGMHRIAVALRETVRSAPARLSDLASRDKAQSGNSLGAAGFA
jgi:hypothetical protein